MRDVDERVAAVQRRASRMKRKRSRTIAGTLATLVVLAFVGLAGMPVASGQVAALPGASSLLGASSLFGASAGGYVIVAVVTAVVVALVTVLCFTRRRPGEERPGTSEAMPGSTRSGEEKRGSPEAAADSTDNVDLQTR